MKTKTILLLFIYSSSSLFNSCKESSPCDLIIHNAQICVVDSEFSIAEAMAIKDGKVVEYGAERHILSRYVGERRDLQKKFVYPGFIDAHCHFVGYAKNLYQIDLVNSNSPEEMLNRLSAVEDDQGEQWIIGRGWDQNLWAEKEFPSRALLDSVFINRPVFLKRTDGHAVLVNTKALQLANFSSSTKVSGGELYVNNEGRLTGILTDKAMDSLEVFIPEQTHLQIAEGIARAQDSCFKYGLTQITDAGLTFTEFKILDSLENAGLLNINIYGMLSDTKENLDHFTVSGPYKSNKLDFRSFKFYADGALGSRGACLIHPYTDVHSATHFGQMLSDFSHFENTAKILYERGFQMNVHCIGDSAVRTILNIFKSTLKGTNDKRWRIEHAQTVHPDDMNIFGEINIIPSVQPTHAVSDMEWAPDRLGKDRIKEAYAYKELFNQNKIIALGTDFPVEGIDPLLTFITAVTRQNKKGQPEKGFLKENGLDRKTTLMGMTIFAAIASFQEEERGSLEAGKKADFVVLNQDLLNTPDQDLYKTQVLQTFIDGKLVYGK